MKTYKIDIIKINGHFADMTEKFVDAENFQDIIAVLNDDEYIHRLWEKAPPNERGWLYKMVNRNGANID